MPGVLYLHGFCSSSKSTKGTFLAGRFAEAGIRVQLPDLDEGDFRNTTLSRQLALVGRLTERVGPALLMGSSLGGFLAALLAARHPEAVPAVALLAPAFDFARGLNASLGSEMDRWRVQGFREFNHYGSEGSVPLDYGFFRDSSRYEAFPDVRCPALVMHGLKDEVVVPELSAEFARGRPNVEIEWFDTDHQMLDVTEGIWSSVKRFYDRIDWELYI